MSADQSLNAARSVVAFWQEAGPAKWFAKDADFDRRFRDTFLSLHEAAAGGKLSHWLEAPESALGLVLLLDQFPRNAFRDTPRMFATDSLALSVAERALAAGFDQHVTEQLRSFFYLPFEHSESLSDQERSLALFTPLGGDAQKYAQVHYDVVQRFGRFPHRNAVLGRPSTEAEQEFLAKGGFSG